MKYLSLIVVVWLLVGCSVDADPMRVADAKVRTGQSDIAVSQSNAQISLAQQADADARRAQENLQALQAQQAIVQAQAVAAQAKSQTDIAASNNLALVQIAAQVAEASKPDYTPLYVLVAVLAVVVIIAIVVIARMNVALAQTMARPPAPPQWRALPQRQPVALDAIPHQVALAAQQRGGFPQHDGERWVIVDATGRRLATQRKQLAG